MIGIKEKRKELDIRIETVRSLLYEKIGENADKNEILRVSEELDKLIADYLMVQAR